MSDDKPVKTEAKQLLSPIDQMRLRLNSARDRFQRALAKKGVDADEFIIGIMTQLNATPKLIECVRDSPESVLLAAFRGAMLGLRFDGVSGEAFMVPRKRKVGEGKYRMEANFQVGYQGVLKNIYRSKEIRSVFPQVVREEDVWEPPEFTEKGVTFRHAPNFEVEDRGRIVAAYARVKLVRDDEPLVFALPIEQIYREHRAVSQAYDSNNDECVWIKYEEAMVLKTMVIYAGKYAPKSTHVAELVNIADRLDKDLPIVIPGEAEVVERPGAVSVDSLAHPSEVTTENNAKPTRQLDKGKPAEKLERSQETREPVPVERRSREPGEDDVPPEDRKAADLFPER
jgi:recombination protein RecT